jgi:hypothetical protein
MVPSGSVASFDEGLKFVQPIPAIIGGSSSLHGTILRTTVVILVTPVK